MRCRPRLVNSLRSIFAFCAALVPPCLPAFGVEANAMLSASCEGEHVQVTLGLPADYRQPRAVATKSPDATHLCISVAQGNPYELLSWLENGNLRAAVLP